MNSAEKQAVLHCLKATIDEALCEECPLYGTTGTDHCENDCVRLAINALEKESCGDCISRESVLKAIDAKAWEFCDYLISKGRNDEQKSVSHFADNLRECVGEDLPSVTAQPKMGHWIEHIHNGMHYIECSKCSSWFLRMYLTRNSYCPNCGAKMQEVEG